MITYGRSGMRPYRSLVEPANVDDLMLRLDRLTPDRQHLWGTLSPAEMLCHLSDAFAVVLGERPASAADTILSRTVVKWIALRTSLPWPKGVPTKPEVEPRTFGTRPADFEQDREAVRAFVRRCASPDARFRRHPFFGPMTRGEWLLWSYGHVDHHLRQFGL
jgi:hypothetical protein